MRPTKEHFPPKWIPVRLRKCDQQESVTKRTTEPKHPSRGKVGGAITPLHGRPPQEDNGAKTPLQREGAAPTHGLPPPEVRGANTLFLIPAILSLAQRRVCAAHTDHDRNRALVSIPAIQSLAQRRVTLAASNGDLLRHTDHDRKSALVGLPAIPSLAQRRVTLAASNGDLPAPHGLRP